MVTKRVMDDAYFRIIFDEAQLAGEAAGAACKPNPMVVYSSDLNNNRLGPDEVVDDGVCGFAWVHVTDGRSAFVKWLKKNGLSRSDVYGGYNISVNNNNFRPPYGYNQSMARKEAHAEAMAAVLKNYGVKCRATSRID